MPFHGTVGALDDAVALRVVGAGEDDFCLVHCGDGLHQRVDELGTAVANDLVRVAVARAVDLERSDDVERVLGRIWVCVHVPGDEVADNEDVARPVIPAPSLGNRRRLG